MEPPNESNPSPSLLSSLPNHIVLSILARISTSYNLTLSLVSKRFRSLILSEELNVARSHLGTREECVYVCLQSRTHLCDRRWFSLWIKPGDDHQTLINHCKIQYKCTENWLLPMPSSYSPRLPIFHETLGSETYEIGGQNTTCSSTDVWVYNKLIGKRRKATSMMVPRKNALTCSLDGKLYVMGGCEEDECSYWGEVFDTKTQTWDSLPDPGPKLRLSPLKKLQALRGKIYVRSNRNNFVYLTKERRWEVVEAILGESVCEIDNVWYCYDDKECLWYDTKRQAWRLVKGLTELDPHWRIHTEICNYGGKLVIVWIGPARYPFTNVPEVWCALILLDKRQDGEVWGHIEWVDVVLRVPRSYSLLHSVHSVFVGSSAPFKSE